MADHQSRPLDTSFPFSKSSRAMMGSSLSKIGFTGPVSFFTLPYRLPIIINTNYYLHCRSKDDLSVSPKVRRAKADHTSQVNVARRQNVHVNLRVLPIARQLIGGSHFITGFKSSTLWVHWALSTVSVLLTRKQEQKKLKCYFFVGKKYFYRRKNFLSFIPVFN